MSLFCLAGLIVRKGVLQGKAWSNGHRPEGRDSSLCVVLLKNPFSFRNPFLLGYVPQHRTLKLQDTRQDREQHHDTSTQTRMTERHHGKNMALVAPPTIERRRQLIVTATVPHSDEEDNT
ncbi:hypothetical protein AVEN_60363-1 [Araneus ventricosus]|uniref:Uncharacterized protein n=1 Tax=Araneus ventricosus TaxID=182803 RepID=A0A4Y2NQP6_ARAVE|nr:hypothetical protein AVEN_60363-1 [Araneus ventricosus]